MTGYTKITYRKEGPAAIIGFNNQEDGNRIGLVAMSEVIRAMDEAKEDPEVYALIFTGEGEVFCLGGRQDGFPDGYLRDTKEYADCMVAMLKHIYAYPKPVIAAINGNAFAGGFMVVESCDLAVASSKAEFCLSELVATGNYPVIALAVNGRAIPKKRLFDIILTGKPVSAETAEKWNLINCVTEPEKVMEKALEYAEIISHRSPLAMEFGRQTYYKMMELTPQMAMDYAVPSLMMLDSYVDAREGAHAAKEGREPRYIRK